MKFLRIAITLFLTAICSLVSTQLPQARANVGQPGAALKTNKVSLKLTSPDSLDARVCDFDGDGKADLALYILPMTWSAETPVYSYVVDYSREAKMPEGVQAPKEEQESEPVAVDSQKDEEPEDAVLNLDGTSDEEEK